MRQLMHEIAAVAEGLRAAGATEIVAVDAHNGGNHFIPELMVAGVRYLTGMPRPGTFHGLDAAAALQKSRQSCHSGNPLVP